MKKKFRPTALLILIIALITGCGNMMEDLASTVFDDNEYTVVADEESVTDEELNQFQSLSDIDLSESGRLQEGLYYYDLLSDAEKTVYSEVLYILRGMMEDVVISTMDENVLEKIFGYVLNDHPELFYVEGYNYTRYSVGNIPQKMTFSGTYNMTPEEVNVHVEKINEYISDFSESLKNSIDKVDDYNIIKFVYEYIIFGTEYDEQAEYNQSIVSVMENGRSVCSGYSKTAQILLNSCGIKTTIVLGRVKDGESHSWNLVLADGKYYYMDVTWGDSSYSLRDDSEEFNNSLPPVNYNYMLMTSDLVLSSHDFDDPSIVPVCLSMEDNYFVREGLYFTAVDEQMLWQAFNSAYVNEREYIMIRMDNPDVYKDMRQYLLGDQKIFDYILSREGSVSYAENPEQLYMIFWL
ncbi:MAG: hypothetical protein K5870_01160 [Lachnospiraceae bacterium]|nr:hypothetical protein [Lachnospiraceae bacterium]